MITPAGRLSPSCYDRRPKPVSMLSMTPRIVLAIAALGVGAPDFAFLQPWFTVERKDRDAFARRAVVVRSLPAAQRQLSVIAACAVNAAPEALIAVITRGATPAGVPGGSFSTTPTLQDLAPLTLDQGDIDRLRQCRPGSCALNLAADEMSALQLAMRTSEFAVHDGFRRMILDRLRRYQAAGLAAVPEYNDRRDPVQPGAVFSDILAQVPYLKTFIPRAANYVERFPSAEPAGAESSFGWSKLTMNSKPVIMVTHRAIFRLQPAPSVPGVLVVSKQIYASRYMNGEVSLTMAFSSSSGSPGYLVVMSRSDLDELGGVFSGLKRSMFEGRIKEEAANALTALRNRMERVDAR